MKLQQLSERAVRRALSSSQSAVFATIVALTFGISFGASAHETTDLSAAPAMMPQTAARVPPGRSVKLQGVLTLIHADYFPQNQSAQALVIHDDNGNDTRVRFTGPQPKLGARVSVTGTVAQDGGVDVSGSTVLGDSTATTLASG